MRLNLTSLATAILISAVSLLPATGDAAQSSGSPPAANTKNAAKETSRPANKARAVPFRGTVKSCNAAAGTFTIGTRTFNCTRETKIYREGKPATLADSRVGEYVTGSYRKADDGKLMAGSIYLGGKNSASGQKKTTGKSPNANSSRSMPEQVEE